MVALADVARLVVAPPANLPRTPLRIVFEGSGQIQIPYRGDEVDEVPVRKPFSLTPRMLLYIERRLHRPWIDRAYEEAYWQCRACGWRPYPARVEDEDGRAIMDGRGNAIVDDTIWPWFSALDWVVRELLVLASKRIDRFEAELATSPRAKRWGGHRMREIVPECQ